MNGPIKNMLVGIFIIGAIALSVSTILFLKPHVGDGKQTLYVRFSDIGKINVGTRVLFAGKPVGEVVAMNEIQDAREQPTDELGRVYFYQLTLHIDSHVKVYNTDEISIGTSGLMGERSISIVPKAPPQGVTPKRITDQPIYADSVDTFTNALLDFSELASSMEETFSLAGSWMKSHGEEVATTIRATGATLEELEQTVASVNESKLVNAVKSGVEELGALFACLSMAMNQMEETDTFKNVGAVMANMKGASRSFEIAAEDIAQGKGTLGKLVTGDDLYLQLNAVMSKANNLMNDVNHYGILFHLNKQWQRTRLQRINQLNALQSPKSFQNYFQQEVDDINTAMARLSMLIDKADQSPEREEILNSEAFKRDFAELLRQADELSDNLRLYNQQFQQAIGN